MFAKIREYLWPLLEKESHIENESETVIEFSIDNVNLEEAYKLNSKITEVEEDRRKGIESKSALFLSSISIVTSLVIAANALVLGNESYKTPIKLSIFITFILTLYALRTVWFSIKALGSKSYHVLDFEDINIKGNKEEFYSHLIKRYVAINNINAKIINEKVDYFVMAQAYYKRAIVVLSLYSFLILLFCLFYQNKRNESKVFNFNKVEIISPIIDKKTNISADTIKIDSLSIFLNNSLDTVRIRGSKISINK